MSHEALTARLALACVVTLAGLACQAGEKTEPPWLALLRSAEEPPNGWPEAVFQAREERQAQISVVIEIAKTSEATGAMGGRKRGAIELLGYLRAAEAVDFLIDSIEFETKRRYITGNDPAERYPSVGALIAIGYPAVDAILRRGIPKGDRKSIELYALVLGGVLGKRAAHAVVASELSETTYPATRKKLTVLLESLK